MNYYHENIVISRRQVYRVRPASVVMSSSPLEPALYPKQVISLMDCPEYLVIGYEVRRSLMPLSSWDNDADCLGRR